MISIPWNLQGLATKNLLGVVELEGVNDVLDLSWLEVFLLLCLSFALTNGKDVEGLTKRQAALEEEMAELRQREQSPLW